MGWDGMGWDGMGWDGMGWDGEMRECRYERPSIDNVRSNIHCVRSNRFVPYLSNQR